MKLQVHGKYLDDNTKKANAGSFVSQSAKDRLISDLNELATSTQRAGSGNPIALFNLANILAGDFQKKQSPEAYLIYALYDQDSNRYEVGYPSDESILKKMGDFYFSRCFCQFEGSSW